MTKAKKTKKKSFALFLLSSNNLISILIVVSIGLAFLVGIMWQKVRSLENGSNAKVAAAGANNPQAPLQAGEVDPVTDSDYVKGSRNARIALIEYSDLECPFCKSFHPTAQQAIDEYPDDIMWVYRHFPLEQLHSKASKQAEAAECAGKLAGNDGFWALTGKIFEVTPSNNGLDNSILPDLAVDVGLNKSAFQTCLDSGEMAQNVDDDYQSGLKAGVTGTPGNILLDTKTGESVLIPGAVPYPQLKQAIDDMLAKS